MDLELRAVAVAKSWRKDPAQWRALSVDDRAWMMAHDQFEATVQAYRDECEKEKKDRKGKGSAANDFEAMKQRLRLD